MAEVLLERIKRDEKGGERRSENLDAIFEFNFFIYSQPRKYVHIKKEQ